MRLTTLFHTMSEHGDQAVSAVINKVGLISITAGGANYVAKEAQLTNDPALLAITDLTAVLSAVGAFVFILKTAADFYYSRKNKKLEHEKLKLEIEKLKYDNDNN